MIKHVTEKETQLSNMLHTCSEALKQVTAERDKLAGELKALRDSDVALPEPSIKLHGKHKSGKLSDESIGMFMEDELRDYGDRRAMAERERCANVCIAQAADADSAKRKPLLTQSGQMLYEGICGGAMNCAIAIRKGETK